MHEFASKGRSRIIVHRQHSFAQIEFKASETILMERQLLSAQLTLMDERGRFEDLEH